MNDADEDVLISRRRTWILGGLLLITAGLAWAAVELRLAPLGVLGLAAAAAAFVVFALGIGPGGSVTGRRPVGTIALAALGVLTVGDPFIRMLIVGVGGGEGPQAAEQQAMTHQLVSAVLGVISLTLAVIAVVAILRAGVVPSPWRWLPLFALIVLLIARGLPYLAQTSIPLSAVAVVFTIANLLPALMLLLMGVAAVMLAAGSRSRVPLATT